jgi:hypothetical protein
VQVFTEETCACDETTVDSETGSIGGITAKRSELKEDGYKEGPEESGG